MIWADTVLATTLVLKEVHINTRVDVIYFTYTLATPDMALILPSYTYCGVYVQSAIVKINNNCTGSGKTSIWSLMHI